MENEIAVKHVSFSIFIDQVNVKNFEQTQTDIL